MVYCYPDELNQIWINLVHNSIQAMNKKGDIIIEVKKLDELPSKLDIDKIDLNFKGNYFSVSIEDTGSGIPPEVRPKIFEAFFTTKPAGEGSGLGLHIVGKILEKHCGGLVLESQPGKTRFTIVLPLKVALN
jgi:two-component system, NtrC family, sensor kinase